jgi:hypothetical protein
MLRDPQLDALLAAHRQFGGTSALQTPTGFLRVETLADRLAEFGFAGLRQCGVGAKRRQSARIQGAVLP